MIWLTRITAFSSHRTWLDFRQCAVPVYVAALLEAGQSFLCLMTEGWRNMNKFSKCFLSLKWRVPNTLTVQLHKHDIPPAPQRLIKCTQNYKEISVPSVTMWEERDNKLVPGRHYKLLKILAVTDKLCIHKQIYSQTGTNSNFNL